MENKNKTCPVCGGLHAKVVCPAPKCLGSLIPESGSCEGCDLYQQCLEIHEGVYMKIAARGV